MAERDKPIIHGRDHDCGGADPIPSICGTLADIRLLQQEVDSLQGLVGGGQYLSVQTGTFHHAWMGIPTDYEITNWPRIVIPKDEWNNNLAVGNGLWARWSAQGTGNLLRIDVQPLTRDLADVNDGDDPVDDAGFITLANSGWLLDAGLGSPTSTDIEIWMRYQGGGGTGPTVDIKNGVLTLQWQGGTSVGGPWPGSYPIVNADVASNADIDPTKLDIPGSTSVFLRGDGTWATPTGGGPPTGTAGGALDGSYPNPGLASSVAGNGLTETADVLSVNVDGSTLEIATDTLRVKDGGVTSAKIADGTITNTDLSTSAAIDPTKLSHPGGTTTFLRADGTWATPPTGSSASDTKAWMPLTTTVGTDDVLVFDADHSLIPTFISF